MTEEWRPTHHPFYDVSSRGSVRSYAPIGAWATRRPRASTFKLLKWVYPGHGYPSVSLGFSNQWRVHALVAAAFLGPTPIGFEICHKDDNPLHPFIENLEFGTRAMNVQQARANGRFDGCHSHVPRVRGRFVKST